jgi:curli biogenesis system outer membrane secretion channel CsgG
MRPAAVNLSGMNQIAVGHIEGRGGQVIADTLSEQLLETNYFEVMNPAGLGRVLKESNLDLINLIGLINPDTAAKFRGLLGVDIIVTGKVVDFNCTQRNTRSEPKKGKDGKDHQTFYKKGTAMVTTSFRITNLTDGNIVFSKAISRRAEATTSAEDRWPGNPDQRALLNKAARAAVASFVREIAPYSEYVTVRLAKNETKLLEMENGINYARAGQWGNAAEEFEAAVRKEPSNQGAWYNLGLAYEYTCQFNEAESAFKKASSIKPCKQCVDEINNVRRLVVERGRLEEQGAI